MARQYDSVRTTAAAASLFDGRSVPAGTEGVVLEAMPDGTCLVELAFRLQTAGQDGDFVLAELAEGQYGVIEALDQRRPSRTQADQSAEHAAKPFEET